jgi:hypothetical protein
MGATSFEKVTERPASAANTAELVKRSTPKR